MTLELTTAQYGRIGQDSFTRRLAALIRQDYPEQAHDLDDAQLRAEIWRQAERAQRYGLQDEQSAASFVLAAWLLGSEFDIRIPAAAQVLGATELGSAAKAKALEDLCVAVFATLEEGRH